jgi:hypothetical protein
MGALWDTKEHHLKQAYQISQYLLEYTLGEVGHEVEEIYSIQSTVRWVDKSSQQDLGVAFEGLQSEASRTWDENLIYIQHFYDRAVNTSIAKSP